ncbi:MAG: hypothetical protein U0570_10550 [Phycisphaerales bacterium]
MAGASISRSVTCPNCGKPIDKTKIQARNAGLFCDSCAAGMRAGKAEVAERQCPACGKSVGEDDVVCLSCGFDYRIGYSPKAVAAQTAVSTSKRLCPKCGRDCTNEEGATSCPACGTGLGFSVSRERYAEASTRESRVLWMNDTFLVPILAMLIAIGLWAAFMWATGQLDLVGLGLIKMGVRYVSLSIVVYSSMLLWLDLEISPLQVAMKLLVVASCGYLAEQVFYDASNFMIAYPFVTIAVIALLYRNLAMELADAAIVAMINWPLVFLMLQAFPPQLRFK